MPLRPNKTPGWLVRFFTRDLATFGGANGPRGGGSCNNDGYDFNGAAVSKVTCVVKWFQGSIRWYCWEGLWTLETLPRAQRLLASYTYPAPEFVPDPGRNQWRFNLWQVRSLHR
jgi:hypothetical protein